MFDQSLNGNQLDLEPPYERSEPLLDCEDRGETLIPGPVNAAGQAYDPAAETYKKQVLITKTRLRLTRSRISQRYLSNQIKCSRSKLTLVGPSSRWRMPRDSWELLGNKETK